ncbi:CPBP family intramembrane glutamic endopeptidase [Actinomadura scrupuli]|uniref:CPBP family intramembrane glutamic endopeptidase n=1 Tax=Actinomadura scrupuli TaxID=559629 RepID=UPI003D992BB3
MTQDVMEPLPVDRRVLGREVVLVLALSLGASGVSALISFIGSVTRSRPLAEQTAPLVTDYAPGRPWLGLAWQLFSIATALVPVALVAHLLARGGESLRGTLGFSPDQKTRDLGRGAVVAAVIGGSGLCLYLAARAAGFNLTVVPSTLSDVWWRIPVLVASAIQNSVVEETIVLGYLVHRLTELGWSTGRTIAASSLLRGSYHLYQGLGGFAGNVVMGVVFCLLYRRWGRVMPLVVAHALIDIVAFVGSVLLTGHVSWLPKR